MDDARLEAAHLSATEMERAIKFYVDTEESPLELACGWNAYRHVEGLRKSLGKWIETRAARKAQAQQPVDVARPV